jgi:hypothetical protein
VPAMQVIDGTPNFCPVCGSLAVMCRCQTVRTQKPVPVKVASPPVPSPPLVARRPCITCGTEFAPSGRGVLRCVGCAS